MPNSGSHAYDVQRTRLRAQYDQDGTQHANDGKADAAANAGLQREHPPVPLGDPDRAAGPRGGADGGTDDAGGDPRAVVLRSTAFVDHGPSVTELPAGAVADRSDDGAVGWHAPEPRVGDSHRMIFRFLALDQRHVVGHGTLVGLVAR